MASPKRTNHKSAANVLTDEDYRKLIEILASQRRLGSYPPTMERLLELANLAWPDDAALTGPGSSKQLLTTAAQGAKKDAVASALVFLSEDLPRLANYERTLRHFIERRLAKVKSQACTVTQMLDEGCKNRTVRDALKAQLKERLEARRLPAGIGALKMGAHYQLFLFDRIIGRPIDSAAPVASQPSSSLHAMANPPVEALEHSEPPASRPIPIAPRQNASSPAEPGVPAARNVGSTPSLSTDAIPSADVQVLAARLLSIFDRLDDASGRNNQVLLYDLRRELGVSREQFDACLDRLRREGVFTLSAEEGRFGRLPADKVEAGIEGPSGRLVYAARR